MRFVFFADTHLDHNIQGPRNENGYPQRVIDILENIQLVVNFAIDNKVDFLLFGGDAYKTNKPLEEYRVMFRTEILRAVKSGITCILIPGNHDMTRRSTADHCLAEFRHYDGVWVIDDPTLLEFEDFNIYGLPWQYKFDPPELTLDKFTVCIAHCTVLGATYQSGQTAESVLGKDFGVELDFFKQFDITCLGHIHRTQTLWDDPFIGYPGSSEWLTWGEMGEPHGFYYFDGYEISHLPYNHRPRIKLSWPFDNIIIDNNASYEITVPRDEEGIIRNMFKDTFDVKLIVTRDEPQLNRRKELEGIEKMNKTELLKMFFEMESIPQNEIDELIMLGQEIFDE